MKLDDEKCGLIVHPNNAIHANVCPINSIHLHSKGRGSEVNHLDVGKPL
jgi:hypothetical protein